MPKYLISFNDGDMNFPEEDFPAVGEAAHKVMREAYDDGIWVFGGGFMGYSPHVVALDGTVSKGPLANSPVNIGGFAIVTVDTDEEAFRWAEKIAIACRCAQEVRRIMDDPEQESLQKSRN